MKFEKTEVWGFEHAIRGVRNPLNSWDKSDSKHCWDFDACEGCWYSNADEKNICRFMEWFKQRYPGDDNIFVIGPKDMELCQKLIKGGPEHRKFLRQIFVSVDITAPLYWWKEFDTYKVGTVANSCSTMHTIHKKEFELEDFAYEHLKNLDINPSGEPCIHLFQDGITETIRELNLARKLYLETGNKDYWYCMIQLLPTSYLQKRTLTMNYENVRTMYFQRRNHKLDEWRVEFCEWVKTLPYAEELIIFDPDRWIRIY